MKTRRIVDNIAWLIVDRAVRLSVGFVVAIFVTRQLGPETYGAYSYAQASVSVLSFLGLMSIEAIVMRMLVDDPDQHEEILSSAMMLRLLGGAATVLASIMMTQIMGMEWELSLVIPLIAAVSLFQAAEVVEYWLRRKLASRAAVVARVVALCVGAVLRLVAAGLPQPLFALAAAALLESALVATLLLAALRRNDPSALVFRPSRPRMAAILRESSPMLLSAIAIAFYVRFGFIVLGNVAGHAQVAQLAVATIVADALHALPVAIAASYGPILLAKRAQAPENFHQELMRMLRVFVLGGALVATLVSLSAPWLMRSVFGNAYAESGDILAVLVWSNVFVYMSIASEFWFVGHAKQRYLLPKTMLAAACFLVLALILIPRYGATGAAVSTILTYFVSDFLSNLLFRDTRPLFYSQLRALLLLDPRAKPRGTSAPDR
jgi:polysaccharide transporter, PST family